MEHEKEPAGGVVYVNLGTMAYIDAWQAQVEVLMDPGDPNMKVFWILPTHQLALFSLHYRC
ncbi:hypothetical protein DVH05_026386 [Phytophthora capsici]|nr:hypothetical protein DVH05_026386 [Phytophthora capsici]